MCALLKRHMYGTRRAADGWQSEYSGSLIEFGFVQSTSSACVFTHVDRQIMVSVHGDDFIMFWIPTSAPLVGGSGQVQVRADGRTTTRAWCSNESSDGQAAVLSSGRPSSGRVIRQGYALSRASGGPRSRQREKELAISEQTPYGVNGARCNGVGPDRPDVQYWSKDICRWKCSPTNLGRGP